MNWCTRLCCHSRRESAWGLVAIPQAICVCLVVIPAEICVCPYAFASVLTFVRRMIPSLGSRTPIQPLFRTHAPPPKRLPCGCHQQYGQHDVDSVLEALHGTGRYQQRRRECSRLLSAGQQRTENRKQRREHSRPHAQDRNTAGRNSGHTPGMCQLQRREPTEHAYQVAHNDVVGPGAPTFRSLNQLKRCRSQTRKDERLMQRPCRHTCNQDQDGFAQWSYEQVASSHNVSPDVFTQCETRFCPYCFSLDYSRIALPESNLIPCEGDLVRAKVAKGEYATESEVIRDGLRTLLAHDRAVEDWLRDTVAPPMTRARPTHCRLCLQATCALLSRTPIIRRSLRRRMSYTVAFYARGRSAA